MENIDEVALFYESSKPTLKGTLNRNLSGFMFICVSLY